MSLETLAGSQQILRHFLMKLVNSLDLNHAYFLQKDNEEAGTTEQTFKIPQVMASNIIEHSAFADYYSHAAPLETRFLECIQIKKDYFYVFGLEQLGYLVLHSERKQIDTGYLNAITSPLVRFAQAYFSRNEFNFNIAQTPVSHVSLRFVTSMPVTPFMSSFVITQKLHLIFV